MVLRRLRPAASTSQERTVTFTHEPADAATFRADAERPQRQLQRHGAGAPRPARASSPAPTQRDRRGAWRCRHRSRTARAPATPRRSRMPDHRTNTLQRLVRRRVCDWVVSPQAVRQRQRGLPDDTVAASTATEFSDELRHTFSASNVCTRRAPGSATARSRRSPPTCSSPAATPTSSSTPATCATTSAGSAQRRRDLLRELARASTRSRPACSSSGSATTC